MGMLLSRRYTRLFSYLFAIVIVTITVHHYVVKSWIKEHRYQQQLFTEDYDIDSLLSEHGIDPNIRADDHIMINVGVRECFHAFNFIQWCKNPQKLYNENDDYTKNINHNGIKYQRIDINKDLAGSRTKNWFGKSLFYSYDVMDISDLVPLLIYSKDLVSLKGFKSISSSRDKDKDHCVRFDELCLEPVDLTIDVIKTRESKIITDFTVLFGDDCVDPRPDWTLLKDSPIIHGSSLLQSYITYKNQILSDRDQTIELHPDEKGKFKIVQLADLHMGVGKGKCIDEFPSSSDGVKCEADPKTLNFINKVLDIEKPQMVVFTGDQIMGDKSLQDSETTLLKALSPVIERGIPWALTWGNHDDEGSLSRWQLSELVSKLPFTLFEFSEFDTHDNTFGVGNYFKQVKDDQGKPLITFYFLDSHKYSKAAKISPGYDWIKEKQWDYFKQMYDNRLKADIEKDPNHLSMTCLQSKRRYPQINNEIAGTFKEVCVCTVNIRFHGRRYS